MIYSVDIKKPNETPIKWLGNVAAFKEPRRVEFTSGLNVLWGRNGSGKTTLLKLLAQMFHCAQGGRPVVTESSISDLFDREREIDLLKAVVIRHDGQSIRHIDPSHTVGLVGGAFDWDFGDEGVMSVFRKGSAGETTRSKFEQALNGMVVGEKPPEIEYRMRREHANDVWQKRFDIIEKIFRASDPIGPPTYLLDEPERSFDIPMQVRLWRFMRAYAPKAQLIVASHSVFALNIPEANYIELEPYLAASKAAVGALSGWANEKPQPIKQPAKKKKKA